MKLGKPNRKLMMDTICQLTGTRSRNVLAGPRLGVDTSVVSLTGRTVLIASNDPISLIPQIGPERSAWLSVHATASDVATSGIPPRYAMFDLNLPPNLSDETLRRYWTAIHTACRELGVAILGGHTGRFEGIEYTVVGGAAMFAIGAQDSYLTSAMAREGDELIATKSAAIEAASVLCNSFPKTVRKALGEDILTRGRMLLKEVSVVEDALVAASVGTRDNGVTAMHDATEGGILSGVLELAEASRLKAIIQAESFPILDEVKQICRLFRIDPLVSLGQGSLVIAARPSRTGKVIKSLRRRGIRSSVLGRLTRGKRHFLVRGGVRHVLRYPERDPYWHAYWRGVKRNLH